MRLGLVDPSDPGVNVTRTVRPGRPGDVNYLYSLENTLHHAVGFIPRGGLVHRLETHRVLVITENGDPAGYVTFTRRRDGLVHVPQVCVDPEIWRTAAGTQLVTYLRSIAICSGARAITLRSAHDLTCNLFWPTQGFILQGTVHGKQRTLNCWALPLDGRTEYPIVGVPAHGGIKARTHRTLPEHEPYATSRNQTLRAS